MRTFFRKPLVIALAIMLLTVMAVGVAWATTIYNLRVTKTGTISCPLKAMYQAMTMYTNASTWTLASTDYGKTFNSPGRAAQVVNLPANGATAGAWAMFVGTGDNNYAPVFTAATTDTLIGPNDLDLKSVTYGTGHRIGFCLMLVSNGTYWIAVNVGSTTMSNND